MTVSVCMIVKNEEANLARALDSVHGIADELVIVDTGSTDGTKEIALQYTDKVYEFSMDRDFSAARNAAFSKCTMDYIYTADADEVLDEENQQKLLELKRTLSLDVEIVQMKYCNRQISGTVYNFDTEYRPKLFKRLRTFHWIDPIHEIIDTQVHVLDSDIVVLHLQQGSHARRDFSCFERFSVLGASISPRLHRLYAQELFLSGTDEDFLRAYDYFEGTLHEEHRSPDEIKQSQCIVSRCCRLTHDSHGLFKVSLKNVIGRPSAEVCCELADYFLELGDAEEAATWYYTAAYGAECELNIHYSGDRALQGLSQCYRKLGNLSEAVKYQVLADQWQPENPFMK